MASSLSPESSSAPSIVDDNLSMLACPRCGGSLSRTTEGLACSPCGQAYRYDAGIPLLFWPNEWDESKPDVTDLVKSFYEANPFPNYDDLDSIDGLRRRAEKRILARLLDEQIPNPAMILEVGCGTGQLSNFLGTVWGRTVIGADICLHSLKLGQRFRNRNRIENCAFVQMNLFRPAFQPESFSLVICNGVLHHTSDPFGGFRSIAKLVQKGGYILVGLYNRYGRVFTDLRRAIFELCGDRFRWLDPHVRDQGVGGVRKHSWLMDQYKHPHESKHSLGEVLTWFEACGFEYVNSIPKMQPFRRAAPDQRLFEVNERGTAMDRFLVQTGMVLSGGREGGFFVVIGRRTT